MIIDRLPVCHLYISIYLYTNKGKFSRRSHVLFSRFPFVRSHDIAVNHLFIDVKRCYECKRSCLFIQRESSGVMAGYRCSLLFLAWLLITIVQHSLKPNRGFDKTSCSIAVSTGLDIKQYPTRNSGPTRRFLREALRVSQGGSLFPCSLSKLPYVPMFPHSHRMFSYCNFSNFVPLFPKIG